MPWRRNWQSTPVGLHGKSHGQWSLAGYSPWGHKRASCVIPPISYTGPIHRSKLPLQGPFYHLSYCLSSTPVLPLTHKNWVLFSHTSKLILPLAAFFPTPTLAITAMNGSFPRITAQPCHTLNSCPLPKLSLYHFISTRLDHSISAFVWVTSVPTESHRDPRSPFRATLWGQSSQTMSFILSSLFPPLFPCLMLGLSSLNLRHNNGHEKLIWSISLYICSTNPSGNSAPQKFNMLQESSTGRWLKEAIPQSVPGTWQWQQKGKGKETSCQKNKKSPSPTSSTVISPLFFCTMSTAASSSLWPPYT